MRSRKWISEQEQCRMLGAEASSANHMPIVCHCVWKLNIIEVRKDRIVAISELSDAIPKVILKYA